MSAQDEPSAKKAREETPTAPAEAAATRTDAPATAAAAADAPTTTPAVAGDPKPPAGGEEAEAESGKGKKRKIAAFLAYVGKGYQGFQRNPGAKTIEDELERAMEISPQLIGVNSRNLKTLEVNQESFAQLLPQIPEQITRVAESGISSRREVEFAQSYGANAILVGEALVTSGDPKLAMRALLGKG